MRRPFAFILGAVFALVAHAQEPPLIEPEQGALGVHTVSWHSRKDYLAQNYFIFGALIAQRRESFCEANPGLYYRAANGFTAGAYRNSYCRASVYAGWTFESDDKRWWATVGLVKYKKWKPLLSMGPALRLDEDLGLDNFGPTTLRLGWIPPIVKPDRQCPTWGCVVWPGYNGGKWPEPKRVHVFTLTLERSF